MSDKDDAHDEDEIEATKAPLMDHLIELRSRLIKALIAFFVDVRASASSSPSRSTTCWSGRSSGWRAPENSKFIYTALLEYFFTQLKLAMFGAAFLSFPVVATQIYMFVAPGLYRHERAGLPALSGRDADLLRARRDGGLFPGHADAGAVLARHAADAGRRVRRRSRCCPRSANIFR